MSDFTNFIPRGQQPMLTRGSPLQSPRESGSPQHHWISIQRALRRGEQVTNNAAQASRRVANQRSFRNDTTAWFHPFKIYQYPQQLRQFPEDTDWRKIKIHGGIIFPPPGGTTAGILIPGSDSSSGGGDTGEYAIFGEIPPINTSGFVNSWGGILQPISDTWHEVIVPDDGEFYYIWVSLSLSTETSSLGLCINKAPLGGPEKETNCLSIQSGNTVTDVSDGLYQFYIGAVYTNTTATGKSLQIKQARFTQISADEASFYGTGLSPKMRFRGQWDGTGTSWYYVGDVVWTQDSTYRYQFIYAPSPIATPSYVYQLGPINNIPAPTATPTADPWVLIGTTPIALI